MKLAWQDPPGVIRDVCHGNPFDLYHPDIAAFYTTEVPDGTQNGAELIEGEWVNPVPVELPTPEPVPAVPQQVTALQGMLALDHAGLSAAFEAWANDPARTFAERAFINKALTWKRNDPVLLEGAAALGITDLDPLFVLAASL